jgi:N-methylhydantoinase A
VSPRDCTLVAFGGGGPLHGCGLADSIGVTRVLVPPHAGVLSAVGLAMARERREAMTSVMALASSVDADALSAMERAMSGRLKVDGNGWARSTMARARYAGQGHELDVELPTDGSRSAIAPFEATHERLFGYRLERPVELVSVRMAAVGAGHPVKFERAGAASAWSDQHPSDTGQRLERTVTGPISIALSDATLYVAPGWRASALDIGGWMLEKEA